ncbi:restriction endonuclease subunit S [Clostridium sp. Marseille-P299]|uniref:restriction endonuclease subunit S n=1 Tax=Clostridium sp. Marseille-P299 TaxID=1805477 RepID=UPI0011DD507B|nr:hypothetical protein [Clostridium sp. Marseille-P299]
MYAEHFSNENGKYIKLSEITGISTKSIMPQGETVYEHYSIPAFDQCNFPTFNVGDDIKSNKYLVSKGDILLSKLNPMTKRLWYPAVLTDNAVCSTEFMIYKTSESHRGYVYALLNSNRFMDYIASIATGSTNSRQRCKPKDTLDFEFVYDENKANEFSEIVNPMLDSMVCTTVNNNKLQILRDTLLPMLMNGETVLI